MNGQQSSTRIREADIPLIDRPVPASPSPMNRVLTVAEIARELRCSRAHVHHLIAGKVSGVRPLPSLWLGRRRLILRASFEEWLRGSEQNHG
jgi:excisionase family DNA binding protein